MADEITRTPYASAMPYVQPENVEKWVSSEYDQQRLAAYNLYDDLYENSPSVLNMMIRGTNEDPKLLPTAKRLVNTMARYVGRGWGYTVSMPPELIQPGDDQPTQDELIAANLAAVQAMDNLFVRENLLAEFEAGIRPWLRRGDWVWYISADPEKEQGSRISVEPIDPRTYFPVMDDPNDLGRVTGCRIVEQITLEGEDETFVKVQEWLKPSSDSYDLGETGEYISYSNVVYELEGWDTEEAKIKEVRQDAIALDGITQLPLYLIQNNKETANPFGHSDLAGVENVLVGINQAASDQDEALAMAGQGMYVTDSGAPIDPVTKRAVAWILGAKRVIQVGQGKKFERIEGVKSIEPSKTHIEMMEERAYGTVGVNDVALGTTQGQFSGVALGIKMSPAFDEADAKDRAINGVWNHILYDLRQWFSQYESVNMDGIVFRSATDPSLRMPFDRDARFQELLELKNTGIIDDDYFRDQLRTVFGYDIPLNAVSDAADPEADRANAELDAEDA